MQERRNAEKGRCRKGGGISNRKKQDRLDSGLKGYRTDGIQEWKYKGTEGCMRKEEGFMHERMNAGLDIWRKGGM